jgi:hypothetical protein
MRKEDKAGLYITVIFHLTVIIILLLAGISRELSREQSFVMDFSAILRNEHAGFERELLYVFGKDVRLLERYGTKEKTVSLYIKINKLENSFVIVISFHEQKYPLKYYFR